MKVKSAIWAQMDLQTAPHYVKTLSTVMPTCVGSWLLPPEHHIVEGILVTLVSLIIMVNTIPGLLQSTDRSKLRIQHPKGARISSLFCFSMMMYYKYAGYPKRMYYVVMPCNMQWVLSVMQCVIIPQQWVLTQYFLLQIRLTFLMSVIIAMVTPETDDCILPGEFAFYWFNHVLLLILPAAYVANGSVSCLPSHSDQNVSTWTYNRLWWRFSCAVFSLFHFIPVTFLAVYSGLNLNFMLHPPHDHFALKGRWFRLVATAMLAALFGVSRWLVLGIERICRRRGAEGNAKKER